LAQTDNVQPEETHEEARPLAVVLLSGGMDSLATAGLALQDGYDLALIHFNYGQKTEEAELRSFHRIAGYFHVPVERRLVTHTNHFSQVGSSALTDSSIPVPKANPESGEIPPTYVPFRNAVLLSMAVSWAESLDAEAVYYGAVSVDSSGYPDCRESFVEAFNLLIEEGTKVGAGLQVRAPLVEKTKAEIVRLAVDMALPLQHTWSCYQRNNWACGICDSCALRKKGFAEAEAEDPVRYVPDPATLSEMKRRNQEKAKRLARLLRALTQPE
jgi:7-cyano-7-deazaguanine synthase